MAPLIELENSLSAYRADPVGEPKGAIVLIHEIWGLVDHITDVADRFAAEGYLVIAPDILSRSGVSPEVGDELQRLVDLVAEGVVVVDIEETFPLEQAADAHRQLQEGHVRGKLVLTVDPARALLVGAAAESGGADENPFASAPRGA